MEQEFRTRSLGIKTSISEYDSNGSHFQSCCMRGIVMSRQPDPRKSCTNLLSRPQVIASQLTTTIPTQHFHSLISQYFPARKAFLRACFVLLSLLSSQEHIALLKLKYCQLLQVILWPTQVNCMSDQFCPKRGCILKAATIVLPPPTQSW